MSRRFTTTLIDAKTAQNEAGYLEVSECAQGQEFGFDIEFDHTAGAGQIVIETAASRSYAGLWAILATVNWSAIDKSHHVAISGSYAVMRARISSAVTSGAATVNATVSGNPT